MERFLQKEFAWYREGYSRLGGLLGLVLNWPDAISYEGYVFFIIAFFV